MVRYTEEMLEFLRENAQNHFFGELTEMFNERFGTNLTREALTSKCRRSGIENNYCGYYKPRFSPEMVQFLKDNIKGTYLSDLHCMFNEHFKTDFKYSSIRDKCFKLHLHSGMQGKCKNPLSLLTKEQQAYLEEIHKGRYNPEIARMLNEKFGTNFTSVQIGSYKIRKKIRSGLTGKYGERKPNGVLIQYQDIHRDIYPIGAERKHYHGKQIYTSVKIAKNPAVWKYKHYLIWEKEHGEVPEGYLLVFKDQNPENCCLENLAIIKKEDFAPVATKHKLVAGNPEVNEITLTIAKIKGVIKEKQKALKESE